MTVRFSVNDGLSITTASYRHSLSLEVGVAVVLVQELREEVVQVGSAVNALIHGVGLRSQSPPCHPRRSGALPVDRGCPGDALRRIRVKPKEATRPSGFSHRGRLPTSCRRTRRSGSPC